MENNQIHFEAEFIIKEGKTEEYKKLVQNMVEHIQTTE
jgi:hypothetical protein